MPHRSDPLRKTSRFARRDVAIGLGAIGLAPILAVPSAAQDRSVPLSGLTVAELMALQVAISDQLGERGVLRSANNPTGDYAEALFCKAFDWLMATKSAKGFDATDALGRRYQIKGRRMITPQTSRQVSALRDLPDRPFDMLAGVLFARDYSVLRAALIPYAVVLAQARYTLHTNSHRFHLRDGIWDLAEVVDVTDQLRAVVL